MCEHVSFPEKELSPGESHNLVGNFHVVREVGGSYTVVEMVDNGIDGEFKVTICTLPGGVYPLDRALGRILQRCLDQAKTYIDVALAIKEEI